MRVKKAVAALKSTNKDEQVGIDIVRDALSEPLRWLVKNAGEDEGYIAKLVEESKEADFGYNVLTGEFGSMVKFGILDPVKVTRSALQNAASVAMMVLTTECLVTDLPEAKKDLPGPGMGMGGGMEY